MSPAEVNTVSTGLSTLFENRSSTTPTLTAPPSGDLLCTLLPALPVIPLAMSNLHPDSSLLTMAAQFVPTDSVALLYSTVTLVSTATLFRDVYRFRQRWPIANTLPPHGWRGIAARFSLGAHVIGYTMGAAALTTFFSPDMTLGNIALGLFFGASSFFDYQNKLETIRLHAC